MKYFAYIIILLAGCTSRQAVDKGDLSLVVLSDSLLAYQGNIQDKPVIEKVAFNWPNVKKIISIQLGNDPARKILIKPADKPHAAINTEELLTWFKENRFNNYRLLAMDSTEEKRLNLKTIRFGSDVLTNGNTEPLRLFTPKEDKTVTAVATDKTYTILLLKDNMVYIYQGRDITKEVVSASTSDKSVRNILVEGKNKFGKDFFVIIKPAKESRYADIVNMLNEMVTNKIEKYALVDITDAEVLYTQKKNSII